MSTCCSHHNSSSEAEKKSEARDLVLRFWISLTLGLPVVFLSMAPMLFHGAGWKFLENRWISYLQCLLTLLVLFWCGLPIWKKGVRSFVSGALNMFSLVCLGTGITFAYSSVILFFPQWMIGSEGSLQGAPGLYFEAAASIMILVLLGQLLESRGLRKANSALRELLELTPSSATLLRDGKEILISVNELRLGDLVRLHPGEKIAVDGIIIEGSSAVNESMVTGESMPFEKNAGGRVTAGTLNGHGSFVMRVEKIGSETMLAQMIAMVSAAQESRAPIQQLADRVSAIFVPVVLGIAAVTFFSWIILSPESGISFALARAIAVLMIACPCALGLATPMAVTVSVGAAARRGILVSEAGALQKLASASIMALDKTGTLTEGRPEVTMIKTINGTSEKYLISLLAAAERGSEHPLAQAVLRYAEQHRIAEKKAADFLAKPGGGVSATIEGVNVLAGSEKFLVHHGVDMKASSEFLSSCDDGLIAVAIDGKFAGAIFVSDPIKPSAALFIKALRRLGIEVAMLTGDRENVARAVAQELGIDQWKAALSPEQKADQISEWKKNGAVVAMAGDGINDAMALSMADASIAMHAGTNIAKETAGIILMNNSLETIGAAVLLSRSMLQVIRQNLFFAFAYNLLAIPIAAGILYPQFGMLLSPMIATVAMSLSDLSVVANSLRLRK